MKTTEGSKHDSNETKIFALIEKLVGKRWAENWSMIDIRCMIREALQRERCSTCKGTGYQTIIGHEPSQGACEDCNGLGLKLPE